MVRKTGIIGILCLVFTLTAQAQQVADFEDLDKTLKEGFFKEYFGNFLKGFKSGQPFSMSGGFGTNLRSYSAWGIDNRQDPFFYNFNANLNITIYKLNLPFSATISARNTASSIPNPREFVDAFRNQVGSYRNRFVRFGTSPSYKWAKLHLGHRGMNFSPLTMSNLNFLGAGTELTPGKVRVSGMYGRLASAQPRDLAVNQPNFQTFDRMGYGIKLGYGEGNDFMDFILFKAKDDPNSAIITDPNQIQDTAPVENVVLGVNMKKKLLPHVLFNLEYASSAYSPNLNDEIMSTSKFPYPNFLYTHRQTSEFRNAIDASIELQGKLNVGAQFKRIDSGYRSLGTYFFNDDLQNMTLNLGGTIKQKLQFSTSGGFQKNNLDNTKPTQTRRVIGSVQLSYALDKLNMSLNYSNFTNSLDYLLGNNLDSLNAIVVTQDAGLNASYNWQSENQNTHVLTGSFNVQMVTDDVANPQVSAASQMITANLSHNYVLKESGWRFTSRLNFNQNELSMAQTNRYGGGLGISKSFLENAMTTNLDFTFFYNDTGNGTSNATLNNRFRMNYRFKKKHTFSLTLGVINQNRKTLSESTSFTELTSTFGYNYRFALTKKKKGEEEKSHEAK